MDEKKRKTILWKLFISTLYLSAFTFGGGYVIVTLMKNKFVDEYHWIEENEMLDLVAIAQSSPGAIAVNGAIVVGYKLAGVVGIFITILGTILPPFIVLTVVSIFYNAFKSDWLISQLLEGMQAGVGAVIASVTVDMACLLYTSPYCAFFCRWPLITFRSNPTIITAPPKNKAAALA